MTIAKLLGPDPLAQAELEMSIDRISARLRGLLPEGIDQREALIMRSFVENPPLTYWDEDTVRQVLDCIERNLSRTFAAMDTRSDTLHRGLENLHRESPTKNLQDAYDHGRASELLILANSFLPEYLNLAENVLGNLTPFIWSVCKKGGVDGKFALKNAIALFNSRGLHALSIGYDDRVRNAIAHGEVKFTGLDIEFGAQNPKKLSSLSFLHLFDDLTRTCSSLGLAIQLFWLKNKSRANQRRNTPLSLITLATAGAVTRGGLRFIGGIESTTPRTGLQLHVALAVDTKSRNQMLLESCRVARELLDQGAVGYDRFLFEVDSGLSTSSLVIVLPKVLKLLIEENAPKTRLPEILPDTQHLLCDESGFNSSLRAWSKIANAELTKAGRDILKEWNQLGMFQAKGRYTIREVRNISVSGLARVEVQAQLVHPNYAEDRDLVNAILVDLIRIGRRRLIRSRLGPLDRGIPWPKYPSYVFVRLFRRDGTSRWLQRDGWAGGNLVAVGERVWGGRDHVLVKKPQMELKKIRVRYEIDPEEAKSAFEGLNELIAKFQSRHESHE